MTQQAAVDLGVTLASGRGGTVKMPSVMGVVSGIPGLLGGSGPVGLVSRAMLLKNMFDPSSESEEGWDDEVKEDTTEECGKFGSVFFVSVDRNSAGHVYVFFRYAFLLCAGMLLMSVIFFAYVAQGVKPSCCCWRFPCWPQVRWQSH